MSARSSDQHAPKCKPKGRIFISKAVILLCLAKKNRDAGHLQEVDNRNPQIPPHPVLGGVCR
jgi:hypothetical protein